MKELYAVVEIWDGRKENALDCTCLSINTKESLCVCVYVCVFSCSFISFACVSPCISLFSLDFEFSLVIV